MENLSFEDVKTAYHKLKSMAYHDSNDLFLKSKIALFETSRENDSPNNDIFNVKLISFEEKLNELFGALTSYSPEQKKEYWDKKVSDVGYKILPKKFKNPKNLKEGKTTPIIKNFFSNIKEQSDYGIDKLILFIDAPVEIHLVSILWLMKLGCNLEEQLDQNCYGNRLILEQKKPNHTNSKIVEGNGLFKPYYKQYQKWRDKGITVAKEFLEKEQDVLFINIDIKDYYYSVRLDLKVV